MFKKAILGALALSAVGALAAGCSSGGDFGPEDETADSELSSTQRGCPQLSIRRQLLPSGNDTLSVSGVQASIVNSGSKVRCGTSATGTFTVGTSRRQTLYMPNPNTRITRRGNQLEFSPSLPAQATWEKPAAGPISSLTCYYKSATLEGSGFPSVSLPLTTEWTTTPDPAKNNLYVTCVVKTPNPLALTADRPKDLISTSGDDFIYRCDMTPAARRTACQKLCSGNSQCMSSCDTSAGCPPGGLCEGSDCPPPGCTRTCSAASDCGGPGQYECVQGCCATIIH